jgi:peptidoglycan/LPS O-acetylase OafA/YrhL
MALRKIVGTGERRSDIVSDTGKYRPDIDGLRAIAVGSVIAFHTFANTFKSGFVGVDVFFVISGFLISGLIIQGLENKEFSYLGFYASRIKRIFPALFVVCAFTVIVGWYVLLPDEFDRLGKQLAAGAGFVTNFALWGEAGYFDAASDTKPLLHLWSLAIEEQFYIVWPLILAAVWKRRGGLLLTASAIGGLSFAYDVSIVQHDPVAAFYSPASRFWELMLGGVLAAVARHSPEWLDRFPNACGAAGLLLIGASVFTIDTVAFPGFWALLPTLGTLLVISAGCRAWINRRLLGNRLLVGIGLISYPLYLWHWPLLVFVKLVMGNFPTVLERAAILAATVMLSVLTYRFVEKPLRRSKDVHVPMGLLLAMGTLGVLALAVFGNVLPSRLRNESIARVIAASYDWQYPPVGVENHTVGELRYFVEKSRLDSFTLFIGDSNMEQYAPRLDWDIRNKPDEFNGAIMVGNQFWCNVLLNFIAEARQCPGIMTRLADLIDLKSTTSVAIAAHWLNFKDALTDLANQRHFAAKLRSIAARKAVYLILNVPSGESLAPSSMFSGSRLGELTTKPLTSVHFDFARFTADYREINRLLSDAAVASGAIVIDPIPYLCPGRVCPVLNGNGTPLYLDSGHMTRSYVKNAATYIDQTLVPPITRKIGRAQ